MAACETHPPAHEAHPARPRRRILVAVDEGDESLYALSWALDHLVGRHSTGDYHPSDLLLLLHVQEQPEVLIGVAGPVFYTTELVESVRKQQDENSKKVLLHAKGLCDERRIDTETMVAIGDARDAICEAVEKLHPEFLVIGSHGYGAVKRAFLGSVSDYCAHRAKCPVVIVKKP